MRAAWQQGTPSQYGYSEMEMVEGTKEGTKDRSRRSGPHAHAHRVVKRAQKWRLKSRARFDARHTRRRGGKKWKNVHRHAVSKESVGEQSLDQRKSSTALLDILPNPTGTIYAL